VGAETLKLRRKMRLLKLFEMIMWRGKKFGKSFSNAFTKMPLRLVYKCVFFVGSGSDWYAGIIQM
jgi:hypothetical protein